MIKLYGSPASNYTCMVHLALLEKNVPFEYVTVAIPDQSDEALAKSPRGKAPYIETPDGFLSETNVILEYLEETCPAVPLLPSEPDARARVRSLMKILELYVELPARLCYPEAFFGNAVPDVIRERSRGELVAGFAALKRAGRFAPYVAGAAPTLADIMFLYSVGLAAMVGQRAHGLDLLAGFEPARDLLKRLAERPHAKTVAAAREAALAEFIAERKAKLGGR